MANSDFLFYSFLVLGLFATELMYFRIAARFRIIDRPNDRSSHLKPVIRGGGVIFVMAVLTWFITNDWRWPWFMLGILLVAVISFMDDLSPQKAGIRFLVHLSAMALMFFEIGLFEWPVWLVTLALIVSIGTLNAFNFMDGINGITGVYSLVTIGTLLYVQQNLQPFTNEDLLFTLLTAVLIFLFFNFRKRARCFAGDVGSVTLAFALIFLLLQLIYATGNFVWILLLLLYGVDSVVTILYRLSRRENIFKAHRTHLYQYLSNEMGFSHLAVSVLYGLTQLLVNVIVMSFVVEVDLGAIAFVLSFMMAYTFIREFVLRKVGHEGIFSRSVSGRS